jgi:two-component sensor histidine kinase
MRIKQILAFFFLWVCSHFSMAQQSDINKIIQQMENANSGDRIRSLCLFYDSNVHSRVTEKFDTLFAECYRIAERDDDRAFKDYLDFYNRIKGVMLIPDNDPSAREAKIPNILLEALAHYEAEGDEHFIAICNAYIGHCYFILKEYDKSIEYLLIADEELRKVGYSKFPDIGKHLHNIALIFYFFRNYDKVAELMESSARLPTYNSNLQIQRYNTLGAAYLKLKQYDKAASAFIRTKETALTQNNSFWIGYASHNIANTYLEKGNYNQALDLYENNLKFMEEIRHGYSREYAEYMLGLVKTNLLLKKFHKARQYLEVIDYKKTPVDKEPMFLFGVPYQDIIYWLNYYEVRHMYHYAIKDYKNAYQYADSLYIIKYKIDSLFNGLKVKVVQNHIEAQKKKYQNDKKEATIKSKNKQMFLIGSLLGIIAFGSVLLYRKNRQINKQNKTINRQVLDLTKTLEQRQMLLSELQHRVKNNLQHVISILEIQKESVDFNNIDELIRGNQNRIHSMALLHKKLNVAENANIVDFKKYVTELAELVKESYDNHKKKVQLYVNCEIEKISIEKALPVGLIITELVSNSMKHAFKKQHIGIINIKITNDESKSKLYYSDNGIGFDFHKLSEKGIGQEIIKGLIDQLDGSIKTNQNNGFELMIYFNNN